MIAYYDKKGKTINLSEYLELSVRPGYGRIAEDHVRGYRISTVWLGLDHSFSDERLEIFETMVFGLEEIDLDTPRVQRYATEAEARAGHLKVLNRLTGRLK